MRNRTHQGYLISKLEVKAKLITSMGDIQQKLSIYPNLRQVRRGTLLGYVIEEEHSNRFYSIELDSAHATIIVYSRTTPLYFLDEALIRLLSILQNISKYYEVTLESLYPYLILALSWQRLGRMLVGGAPAESENTDIILSKRLIELTKSNMQLNEVCNAVINKSRRLLLKLIVLESASNPSIEAISKSAGVRRDEVEKALHDMHESGYKAVLLDSDRFNLVRL